MQPTTSRKTILLGLAVVVVLVSFFIVSVKRGALPDDKFTPPVYVQDELPTTLIRPLYLEVSGVGLSTLTQEQKQRIADFKKKILTRVSSGSMLTSHEKTVLAISISTTTKSALGDLIVADQSVFQFNAGELEVITRALES